MTDNRVNMTVDDFRQLKVHINTLGQAEALIDAMFQWMDQANDRINELNESEANYKHIAETNLQAYNLANLELDKLRSKCPYCGSTNGWHVLDCISHDPDGTTDPWKGRN